MPYLQLFMFTASGFSRDTVDYANDKYIALFEFGLGGAIVPANAVAELFLHRTAARANPPEDARPVRDGRDLAEIIVGFALFLTGGSAVVGGLDAADSGNGAGYLALGVLTLMLGSYSAWKLWKWH